MKNKEQKNMNERENKQENRQEAALVTKESMGATFALFSFLAFLILCTRSVIFGEFGKGVYSFLTGLFGYMAYPVVSGALYLSVMLVVGTRLVKNRKAFACIALTLVCAALIVHTALTYSWELKGYLKACFHAGESLATVTATGCVGGLFVFAAASLLSKIGAIVLFSALFLLCGYLAILTLKKPSFEKKAKPAKKANTDYDIPLTSRSNGQTAGAAPYAEREPQPNGQTAYSNGYATASVQQRPSASLPDEGYGMRKEGEGFSPFGAGQAASGQATPNRPDWLEQSYRDSREFLFGSTPAENYRRNLIFDPNSKANQLPATDPSTMGVHQNYTPSYSDAYQSSVNEEETENRPTKIVTDNAPYSGYYMDSGYAKEEPRVEPHVEPTPYADYTRNEPTPSVSPFNGSVAPMQPIEEPRPMPQEPISYPTFDGRREEPISPFAGNPFERTESVAESRGEERIDERASDRETLNVDIPEEPRNEEYKRHEYMDLFSPSNPNVFGREEASQAEDIFSTRSDERDSFDRGLYRESFNALNREADAINTSRERDWNDVTESARIEEVEEDDARSRDALHIFDDTPEDNPYTLRSDFSEPTAVEPTPRAFENVEERGVRDVREDALNLNVSREVPYVDSANAMPLDTLGERSQALAPKKEVEKPKPAKPRVPKPYVKMSLDDMDCRDIEPTCNAQEVEETKETIIATLEDFKVTGASIASVTFGPTVTRYNVTLPRSISPRKVVALDQSIAISLHSSGVNIYPNYEDGVVSIEAPNKERQFVQLGCMLSGDTFVNAKPSSLMFAMGKDVANRKVYGDISKMIHMLVAGASGSGKSVFLGALIISLIYKYSPEELRLILIDPKKTEFVLYNDLPHLMINEIITDVNKAVQSLNWAIEEMNRRYALFEQMSRAGKYVVNLDQYNAQVAKHEKLPKIVIIIDELADLMLAAKKEMEERIQNLTQKARAAGIHLIVATQRPSTDVITGVIKSNLPTRIAFGVATDVDSRVILDQSGAQKLLGKGDFLYTMQGINTPVRVQSAFISPEESQKVVNFIKANNEAYYDEEATAYINNSKSGGGDSSSRDRDNVEPVYIDALRYVILSGSASISMIQRKCSAGYNKAGKIIEWMEDMGYISPFDGAKARKVLISKEQFEEKYGPL